jgi:hypothetical protein
MIGSVFASRPYRRTAVAVITALVAMGAIAGCGTKAPDISGDAATSFGRLTGADGQNYLRDLSVYEWDDRGAAAGNSLAWIGTDAGSPDAAAASRAGQAAHALAVYLAGSGRTLIDDKSLGQRSPDLVRAYAAALAPFQSAMLGRGASDAFPSLVTTPSDYSGPRTVFAVIDTDTQAGNDFTAKAYETADTNAKQFAANFGKPADGRSPTLSMAAYLSGVAYGGAQAAQNDEIVTRRAQQALDHAAYNVAASLQPPPGPNDFDPDYFIRDGPLKPPDKVPGEGAKIHYSEQLQLYVGRRAGIGALMTQFDDQFNRAAGIV